MSRFSIILIFIIKIIDLSAQNWINNGIVNFFQDKVIYSMIFNEDLYALTNQGLVKVGKDSSVVTYILDDNSFGVLSKYESLMNITNMSSFNVLIANRNTLWLINKISRVCLKIENDSVNNFRFNDSLSIYDYDLDENGNLWIVAVPLHISKQLNFKLFYFKRNEFIEESYDLGFIKCCLIDFKIFKDNKYFLYNPNSHDAILHCIDEKGKKNKFKLESDKTCIYKMHIYNNMLYILSSNGKLFRLQNNFIDEYEVPTLSPSWGFDFIVENSDLFYTNPAGLTLFTISSDKKTLLKPDTYDENSKKIFYELFYDRFNRQVWLNYQYKIRGIDTCSGISVLQLKN